MSQSPFADFISPDTFPVKSRGVFRHSKSWTRWLLRRLPSMCLTPLHRHLPLRSLPQRLSHVKWVGRLSRGSTAPSWAPSSLGTLAPLIWLSFPHAAVRFFPLFDNQRAALTDVLDPPRRVSALGLLDPRERPRSRRATLVFDPGSLAETGPSQSGPAHPV